MYKNFTLLLLFSLFSLNACNDPCSDVNCGPNGSCREGDCNCDEGYEGEFCELELRERFVGTWIDESPECEPSGPARFSYTMVKGEGLYELILTEESNPDIEIKLTIGPFIDSDISIYAQEYVTQNEIFNYSGFGRYENDQIIIRIKRLSTHYPNMECNLTLTKIS